MFICLKELGVLGQVRRLSLEVPQLVGMAYYYLNMESFVMVFLRGRGGEPMGERE